MVENAGTFVMAPSNLIECVGPDVGGGRRIRFVFPNGSGAAKEKSDRLVGRAWLGFHLGWIQSGLGIWQILYEIDDERKVN